ncbi:MAG: ADOP family duplicated permease, partial [Vicinamibacterales bacterium]
LFDLLGVEPIAGRTFGKADGGDGVVISERFWERRFQRSHAALGSRITLDDRPFTIVGVMPDRFQFPYSAASLLPGTAPEARTDIWVPFGPGPGAPGAPRRGRVSVVARLKPGVSPDAAQAELRAVASRIEEGYRGTDRRVGVRLEPLADAVLRPVRSSLWLLFGAVGLVLLTACANVANLLLARMTVRTREVVTRAALGASRVRLARQFLAESLLLALGGGLAGIALARWGTDLLVTLYTGRLPRAHEIALDWQVLVFLLLACVGTAVLFGLPPAFASARVDPYAVTKESGGQQTTGRPVARMRDALAAVEIALAFALGVGALLVMREMIRLQQLDPGMKTGNVAVLHVTPRAPAADYYAIEARTAALPGVEAAGFIQLVPLQNWGWEAGFDIRGRAPDPGVRPVAELRYVTPGYFRALGVPIVKGRGFMAGDVEGAPRVILVNEALVRRYFSGEEAVGRELDRGTIVGIVGDVRNVRLDRPADPEIYYPAAQNVTMTSDLGMSLVVRAAGDPEPVMPAIRRAVLDVNPKLAIFDIKTMDQIVDESLWELRLYRWLIGLFAALALVLAAIGLYGVVSCSAAARTREFAIRLALGSGHAPLARLVMRRAVVLTSTGLACGLATVLLLTWLAGEVPNLRPDAPTCAAVAAVLFVITLGACAVPATRATSIDLVSALRRE